MSNDIVGKPGEVHFTVTIKRAATGKEETYEMVGVVSPDKQTKGDEHGSNS